MKKRNKVLGYINKRLFDIITNDVNHLFHKLAVHEYVDGKNVYYIKRS